LADWGVNPIRFVATIMVEWIQLKQKFNTTGPRASASLEVTQKLSNT